ncbi:hypothetical protein U2S91_23025 [Stenotrophomonas maltophilia]|nr:helix-hairpin-helix domain-containing protein [Stenotrophomonas maltophilia]WQI20975.1 hypothetical protein U2S91_23025 [Stenotrophomonas maltophilia]
MREASIRTRAAESKVFGVYLSLRYLPLLRETGLEYEKFLVQLICDSVSIDLDAQGVDVDFSWEGVLHGGDLQRSLAALSLKIDRRIVLFLDDAAHLGRENSSSEFFDIFRTISSRSVSCKAAIYPGVTNFGKRFDVFNDATVIDVSRDESNQDFGPFFSSVVAARYPDLLQKFSRMRSGDIPAFLGRAVLGNMRAFVFACNRLSGLPGTVGMPELTRCLIDLCAGYYWPLLDEVQPKLGRYEPLVDTSRALAVAIFQACAESRAPSVIIHRDFCQNFSKSIEVLEYAGFIAKREASRALKKGGRGPRYAVNLANLLEVVPGARLTQDLYQQWNTFDRDDLAEIQKSSSVFEAIAMPPLPEVADLGILSSPINALAKSAIYPYGLTPKRIEILTDAGYKTVGQVAEASDADLMSLPLIKDATLNRIRSVLMQAIWM